MVKKYFRFMVIASVAAALSLLAGGCSQKTVRTDEGSETATAEKAAQSDSSAASQGSPQSSPAASSTPGSEEPLDTPAQSGYRQFPILEGRSTGPMLPVYFDFDQSSVRVDQKGRIEKNARYLKDNPGGRIVIEGNCDERGTNEYNMALGERRAISAKKYMMNLGVQANRMNTISYGEEKPLNHGHDELAWSQNRRADFVQVQ